MKAVILAGGLGTRLSEETSLKPKPMVEIGGFPILWHILKIYYSHGINEFIICCGYKGYIIKEYFQNYNLHNSDVTFDFNNDKTLIHQSKTEKWSVTLVDTGNDTQTGGRIKRIYNFIKNEKCFHLTYGDGLADINIEELAKRHKESGKLATVTAVTPPGRFGALSINNNLVENFLEKPSGDGSLINGGFFILNPEVVDFIDGDNIIWEQEPLRQLSQTKQLNAYHHTGFWQPMDTLREKKLLENLWLAKKAPWKVW